ncbi:hypothetical protein [Candidatus Poriferisodalis sp.]|uniref:hypothetical protein n=1 Tax=Candidatus Poriferisodalis sp. TaxID=3101277 RepID=UPI003D111CB7
MGHLLLFANDEQVDETGAEPVIGGALRWPRNSEGDDFGAAEVGAARPGDLLLVDRQFGVADISEWKTEPHPSCSLDGMAVVASDLSVEDFAALPGIVDRLFEVQQSGRTQTETKSGTQPVADVAPFPDCYPRFSTNAAIAEDGGYVSVELARRISRVYAPWPGTVLVELSRSDTEVHCRLYATKLGRRVLICVTG